MLHIVLCCLLLASIGLTGCMKRPAESNVGNDAESTDKRDATSFEFGKVRSGEIVQHVFALESSNMEPLRVVDVQTFCGCTAADVVEDVIPPGGRLDIPVSVNTAGKRGRISQDILIRLSDESRRRYTVTGYVYNKELAPIKLDFSGDSKKDSAQFYLDWPELPSFQVLDTTLDSKILSVYREDMPDRRRTSFTLALLPPASYGIYTTRVVIQTNDPFEREYFVPVEGYFPFPIEPKTYSIAAGKLEAGQSKSVEVVITAPYGGQLDVKDVRYVQGTPGSWQLHRLGPDKVQVEFEVVVPEKTANEAIITKIEVDAALPDYQRSFQIEAIGIMYDI